MPATTDIVRQKDYCDLLYAWIQCNSERVSFIATEQPHKIPRRIAKKMINYSSIEKDFTRPNVEGKAEKIMSRKTISKYFNYLIDKGLIYEKENDKDYYYLAVLDQHSANLIEYNTLSKLQNTLQKSSISIYIYLFNRYFANGCEPYQVTIRQIKEYIGIATSTTSNNLLVTDTLDILKRLGLVSYDTIFDQKEMKSHIIINGVRNQLPEY